MSSEEQTHAAFERLEAAFAARDMDTLADCWDENIDYATPAVALTGRAARIAAEQSWFTAFPDAALEYGRTWVVGDTVIAEGRMIGTHMGPLVTPAGTLPPSGRSIAGTYVSIMRFAGGRVVHQRLYFDQAAMAAQLGA
jgi:predicted ester cyclase